LWLRRIAGRVILYYFVICLVLAIFFGELAFRLPRAIPPDRREFQSAVARDGAVLQDVSVTASDGTVLRGWFARPTSGNGDAVILLHGIGDNRQGMTGFAELFLSKGYEVLLSDLRAHGTSGGAYPTYGIKENGDLRSWFSWLMAQHRAECVYGMGESMGAAIILQAIETTPFCAVVAESPFASFREIAYVRVGQMFHTGSWMGRIVLRPAVELAFMYARLTRHVNLDQVSPQNAVAGSGIPILLIHGLADENIPAAQSETIRSRNPSDITLWEVPNAGHCGASSTAAEEFDSRVVNWFSTHHEESSGPRGANNPALPLPTN
jgi:pimeloyl-ACP methyl ester carboxylesterase